MFDRALNRPLLNVIFCLEYLTLNTIFHILDSNGSQMKLVGLYNK